MMRRPLSLLSLAIIALLLGGSVAQAVWTEPAQYAPSGNPAAPIHTGSLPQVRSGSLTVEGGISAQTPVNTSVAGVVGTLRGTGGSAAVGGTAAGVRGAGPTSGPNGAALAGVFGTAGTNQLGSVGVYGSNGGHANAWAGYFNGSVGANSEVVVQGNLAVAGSGTLGSSTLDPYLDVAGGGSVRANAPAWANAVALVGELTAPATSGYGVLGAITPTRCGYPQGPCAGIGGWSGAAGGVVAHSGILAGYFRTNLNVDGTLSDSLGTFPRAAVAYRSPVFSDPAHFANLPSGSVLGTFNVGSDSGKRIVPDGIGIWVGARTRIRPSDGAVLVSAAGNGAGGLAYDGKHLWFADSSVSPNVLRRISTTTGLDAQTFTLPGTQTFATNTDVYFDGSSVWTLTCVASGGSTLLNVSEFTRFDAAGAEVIANPRNAAIAGTNPCNQSATVQGNYYLGRAHLYVSYGLQTLYSYEYTASTFVSGVARTFNDGSPDAHFFDAGNGPGWLVDADTVWVSDLDGDNSFQSAHPLSLVEESGYGTLSHLNWMTTDGTLVWGVDSSTNTIRNSASPSLQIAIGNPAGPIAFDGAYLWIGGINGNPNVYKYLP